MNLGRAAEKSATLLFIFEGGWFNLYFLVDTHLFLS